MTNRRLSDLMTNCPLEIAHDEPSILGGVYRVVLLRKEGRGWLIEYSLNHKRISYLLKGN